MPEPMTWVGDVLWSWVGFLVAVILGALLGVYSSGGE